jgi:hypothetical protein
MKRHQDVDVAQRGFDRSKSSSDSPLEGSGFEPLVPP